MRGPPDRVSAAPSWVGDGARAAGEGVIAALFWLGMNELAHWHLDAGRCLEALFFWWAALGAGRGMGRALPDWRWARWSVECLMPAAGLAVLNHLWAGPLRLGQIAYAVVLVGVAVLVWRAWVARNERRAGPAAEPWRVLLLLLAAVLVMRPYFSDRYVGGSDVRWYAFVLQDFLDQMRSGHFPVLVGQGRFAWSGAVHPFRSAPVYLNLAGLWDLLTLRTLNVFALQHLAAITSAVAGALGFYAAGARLAPHRRWEVWLLALLYVASAAWLGVLFRADAYMSFMALGAMPLVLYGNARTLRAADGRGFGCLAAGLALLWMCHPPIALLTTLVTLLLQGGSLLLGDPATAHWRGMAGGVLLFAGMGAYYFAGMSELPKFGDTSPWPAALQFGGLGLVLAGLVNAVTKGRGWLWLGLLVPGGWLLWLACVPWFFWMAATVAVVAAATAVMRACRLDAARGAVDILLPALVGAACLVQAWLGPNRPDRNLTNLIGLTDSSAVLLRYFPFVPRTALAPSADLELGAGVWLVLAALLCALRRPHAVALKLFFFVGLLFLFSVVNVPLLSNFFVEYFPEYPARIIAFPLDIRVYPVMASFVLMGGVVWTATASDEGRSRAPALALLGVAVALTALQAAKFSAYGPRFTSTLDMTLRSYLPENFVLDRFAYDLLPTPRYFSNGAVDPRLQFRLLDADRKAYTSPDGIARRMEAAGSKTVRLEGRADPSAPRWLNLSPVIAVAPGEELLLRFEFVPNRDYRGVLIMQSQQGYREYQLPMDGQEWGFGTRPGASRVLELGNSQPHTEHYGLSVVSNSSNPPGSEGLFATVIVSRYDPAANPVRVDSWDPLEVAVQAERPGWLETPRSFLPGYRATVDSLAVPVAESAEHAVMVPLAAGDHVVELRYRGTLRLWAAAAISFLTWTGWLGFRWRRGGPA